MPHTTTKFTRYSTLIAFILITTNVCGQYKDSILQVYNNQTIQTQGKKYIIGTNQYNFSQLKPQFTSESTMGHYKRAKGNLVTSRFLTVAAVGALVTSVIIKKDNEDAATAISIGGLVLNLSSLHFRKKSSEWLQKAIWLRNREILFGQ